MIALYLKNQPERLREILSSLKTPFRRLGNVFVINTSSEDLLNLIEHFPKDIVGKVRICPIRKEEISGLEDLLEIGFRSSSLEEFVEEKIFESLYNILNSGEVYFQPIIEVKSRRVYGFEALCRLSVPIYKLFKVSDRISYMADKFCREKAIRDYIDKSLDSYHLFLNFHPKFLKNPLENVGELITILINKGIQPSKIVVEIDEYEGVDISSIKLIRDFLKAEEVKVALDDVGAGYSGLYHLMEIHPDIAKLDLHIIRGAHENPIKRSILEGLVKACKDNNIEVLAEGVESVEDLNYLIGINVDMLQGFVFAKPSPNPDIRLIEELAYNLIA